MQAQRERSGSGLLWIALLILAALIAMAMLPRELPSLQNVRYREHATLRHGCDALDARACVQNCSVDRLRVKLCPPTSRHGLSVVYWCALPMGSCPGTVLTIGGLERTSYYRPCADWSVCR